MRRIPIVLRSLLLLALPALALVGCRGELPPDSLQGSIQIDGSSTVFPLTEAVAEEFMRDFPGVRVTVGVSGTGGGFAKFLRRETDISNASRPIKSSEAEEAMANGLSYIEIPVAYDGLAVITHPETDWVDCLSVDELKRIWEPGAQGRLTSWAQVRPGFPDRPIRLYGPGTDSGTYDYFTKVIVGEEGASRTDFSSSEDDNVLVMGVEGEVGSMGFFGLAYYEENVSRLKVISVDNGSGCVTPTAQTVQEGAYKPLARPEFIYVNAERAQNPAVRAFVDYYLQYADELTREVGSVPLHPDAYLLAAERYREGHTGSVFGGFSPSRVGMRVQDVLAEAAQAALMTPPAQTVATR